MTFSLIGGKYSSKEELKVGSFSTPEKARQQVKFYQGRSPTASFIIDGGYFDYYDIRIQG